MRTRQVARCSRGGSGAAGGLDAQSRSGGQQPASEHDVGGAYRCGAAAAAALDGGGTAAADVERMLLELRVVCTL